MRKKPLILASTIFVLYVLIIYIYLFHFAIKSPADLKNTSLNPETFMTGEQIESSIHYANIKNFLFFILTPLEWLFYFIILYFGVTKNLIGWGNKFSKKFRTLFFTIALFFIAELIFLPFKFYIYRLSIAYNISTQAPASWFKDYAINSIINLISLVIAVYLFNWLYNKNKKKWWLYAWACMVPITLVMVFIQPVVIDPLFNDFTPLKNKELETRILALAGKANIPTNKVFEVNMSEKTSSLNAYVTGIGSNSRIVLWDTTLEKLSEEEILFVMAHEMAHYIHKDIYLNVGLSLVVSLVGLWLLAIILQKYRDRQEKRGNYQSALHFVPLLLLWISILSFIYQPLNNVFSRSLEWRADKYAVRLTNDAEAGISSFQKLSAYGLVELDPPMLVKLFRYSHPTMLERLEHLQGQ